MNEQKLYRYEGNLYRAEPTADGQCGRCAFYRGTPPGACGKFRKAAVCNDSHAPHARTPVARIVPPTLPIPASVTIVELN